MNFICWDWDCNTAMKCLLQLPRVFIWTLFSKMHWQSSCVFQLAPTNSESLVKALDFIKNPRKLCEHVYSMVKELTAKIRLLKLEHRTRGLFVCLSVCLDVNLCNWEQLRQIKNYSYNTMISRDDKTLIHQF